MYTFSRDRAHRDADIIHGPLEKLVLYARTLRHLKPWQVAGRICAAGKRRFGLTRRPETPPGLRGELTSSTPFLTHDPWNTKERLRKGRFTFLNRAEELGRPVGWHPVHLPLLWRFNLHYFHYLYLLPADEQLELCRSWIQSNPVGNGVGWHPYPTALRIVNWCKANVQDTDIQVNLYQQAAFLFRNLETYIYGNHLLENARALVLAGRFFDDQGESSKWQKKGLQIFRQETPEQILPDGGHYERTPMYHALMLEAYLDIINSLPDDDADRPALCSTAGRMTDFLHSLLRPDGRLPLFNDATHEIALPARMLLDYAYRVTGYKPERTFAFPESGYFVHRDDDVFLAIDGGSIGPDHLLAHAHGDIFSFELFLGGLPFIVDSGVFEYQAGDMRNYVRSTKAHNTICIDGVDQAECWNSFRVARRFAPYDVQFSHNENSSQFTGSFSGYASLIGDRIVHHRSVTVDSITRIIEVDDRIEGRGTHQIESRLHLHPDVHVDKQGMSPILKHGAVECSVEIEGASKVWEEGWYCPRFGVRQRNQVLVVGGLNTLPIRFTCRIYY